LLLLLLLLLLLHTNITTHVALSVEYSSSISMNYLISGVSLAFSSIY